MTMRFPRKIVDLYGAKAGILLYVARELPDIPQARMIIKTPDECIDDFLKRADSSSITYPRIYRSSTFVELDGYEGEFLSEVIEDFETARAKINNPKYCGAYSTREKFDHHVRSTIESVESSTARLREQGHPHLPEKINVIAAEKSTSLVNGTYIKHPNQEGFYLITCTLSQDDDIDPIRSNFSFSEANGVETLWGYEWIKSKIRDKISRSIEEELSEVLTWHDRINSLQSMDSEWSYQIEFGLFPTCLYQVRPFKKMEFSDFKVERTEDEAEDAIVIGTTAKDGLLLRVETDVYDKASDDIGMNPEGKPAVLVDSLRSAFWASDIPNHQANIFGSAYGFLQHNDVSAMRHAQVTVLYGSPIFAYKTGDMIKLTSDGMDFVIEQL